MSSEEQRTIKWLRDSLTHVQQELNRALLNQQVATIVLPKEVALAARLVLNNAEHGPDSPERVLALFIDKVIQ